jgi:hypothetical protein
MLAKYTIISLLTASAAAIAAVPKQTQPPTLSSRDLFDGARDLLDKLEGGAECVSAAAALGNDLPPAPTGDLLSAIISVRAKDDVSDNCLATYMPTSLSSSYSAYESSFVSWYNVNKGEIEEVESECGTLSPEISSRVLPCPTAAQVQSQQQQPKQGDDAEDRPSAAAPAVAGFLGAALVGAMGAVFQFV